MVLHNLSQRHVSALSWAIFRLNTFLCEVNHTANNVMSFLSTRYRVTSPTWDGHAYTDVPYSQSEIILQGF